MEAITNTLQLGVEKILFTSRSLYFLFITAHPSSYDGVFYAYLAAFHQRYWEDLPYYVPSLRHLKTSLITTPHTHSYLSIPNAHIYTLRV
jgi:hypothetical protein